MALMKNYLLLQETTETKRKNAKRTFKSEKEFLEFTLSYQKVLSERDAGEFNVMVTSMLFDEHITLW